MKTVKILLINTNRYKEPPVIPLAIETLYDSLINKNIETHVLDLCFSSEPLIEIEKEITNLKPDVICLSIRNVDSGLYPKIEFYLPEIKTYVERIRHLTHAKIIIGGAALTTAPNGIHNYLKPDISITGPGEVTLPEIILKDQFNVYTGKIIKGLLAKPTYVKRASAVDYKKYVSSGALAGFETHKGCSSRCPYCVEAKIKVSFKNERDVLSELFDLKKLGIDHLHACDSEFNEDLKYCISLLEKIVNADLSLKWALYMKPGNYNAKLFELLRKSGAYHITMSIESCCKDKKYWDDVKSMIELAKACGIRIVADLLVGLPMEDESAPERHIKFFKSSSPDEVVFVPYFRLYESAKLTSVIANDKKLSEKIIYPLGKDGYHLKPAFYFGHPIEFFQQLIGSDPLFRLLGEEKIVDYLT